MAEVSPRERSDRRKADKHLGPGTAPAKGEKELGSDEQEAIPRTAAAGAVGAVGAVGIYNSLAQGRWPLHAGMPCWLAEGSDAVLGAMRYSLASAVAYQRAVPGLRRRT